MILDVRLHSSGLGLPPKAGIEKGGGKIFKASDMYGELNGLRKIRQTMLVGCLDEDRESLNYLTSSYL